MDPRPDRRPKGYRFVAAVERRVADSIDGGRRVMMAVLPFTNLGAGAEREYIADGFTEEAIAALGQLDSERLGVIGRTSVMGDVHLIFLPVDPKWDEIRPEPRVRDLMNRCGFAKPSMPAGSADRDAPAV